jgi:hypothetical protein
MDTVFACLYLLLILCTPPGVVVGAVGGIVRLCEASWGKPAGGMGSRGLLRAAGLLLLPAAVYVLLAVTPTR